MILMKPAMFSYPTKEERALLESYVGKDISISFLLCGQEKEINTKLTGVEEYGISIDPRPQHYALDYMVFSGARGCGIFSITQDGEVLYSSCRN
jgi:hypothetical protein